MKTIAFCLLLVAAVSGQGNIVAPARGRATPVRGTQARGTPTRGAGAATAANPLGPRFFGPGLNNALAIPPNPAAITLARQVLASQPNLMVRVDPNGDVTYTDRFGREVEVVDQFGQNPQEVFEQQQELEQERLERELEIRMRQHELTLRRQLGLLPQGPAGVGNTGGVARTAGARPGQRVFSVVA